MDHKSYNILFSKLVGYYDTKYIYSLKYLAVKLAIDHQT